MLAFMLCLMPIEKSRLKVFDEENRLPKFFNTSAFQMGIHNNQRKLGEIKILGFNFEIENKRLIEITLN